MSESQVVCFGVSHHNASVEVRERIRFALFDGRELLESSRKANGNGKSNGNGSAEDPLSLIQEMVLVSTCNRVELYAVVETVREAKRVLFDLVMEASRQARLRAGFEPEHETAFTSELIDQVTYYYEGDQAVHHLCSVTCGLDSMVLGETQILTQINEAYENAREACMAGPVLTAVFHAARRAGKRARTQTHISANASSISSAAVALAKETVGDLAEKDITVVGLGEMGQLALKTLYARGARRVRIVNRTVERAAALAQHVMAHTQTKIDVHGLQDLPEVLETTDVLIAVTGKEGWIVDAEMARTAAKKRGDRDLVIIDIAVPRNVQPTAGDVDGIRVFDTDDIQAVKDSALAARRKEIPKVEVIIAEEMRHLEDSLCKVELKPLITELRRKAEAIRQSELERTYRKLGSPDPKTWEHVQHLSRALVNKLYHHPTNIIKEKATEAQADAYAATIRELFGLSKTGGDSPDGA